MTLRAIFRVFLTSRGVAQPGSAPALGAGGRRFESGRPDHFFNFLCNGCATKVGASTRIGERSQSPMKRRK